MAAFRPPPCRFPIPERSRMFPRRILPVVLLMAALPAAARAAEFQFIAPTGNYQDPANWSPATVPGSGDTVIFPAANVATLSANASALILLAPNGGGISLGLTPPVSGVPGGTERTFTLLSAAPDALHGA